MEKLPYQNLVLIYERQRKKLASKDRLLREKDALLAKLTRKLECLRPGRSVARLEPLTPTRFAALSNRHSSSRLRGWSRARLASHRCA